MFEPLNAMMLEMLAAIGPKDYDRQRRQMRRMAKATREGKDRRWPEDKKRNTAIMNMLNAGCRGTRSSKRQAVPTRSSVVQLYRGSPGG